MDTKEETARETYKVNVAGAIRTLKVGGSYTFDLNDYDMQVVRSTASRIGQQMGRVFITNKEGKTITVTRLDNGHNKRPTKKYIV